MSENVQDTGNLSQHQIKVLDCLANGATKDQAAAIVGVTVRTINRWLAEDDLFQSELDHLAETAVNEATYNLSTMLKKANTAIQGILDNAQAKDRDKIRAASLVYNTYIKMRQFGELDDRITALEERLNEH